VSDDLTIKTDGGTTFTIKDKQVTIHRAGQPDHVAPLGDLLEFLHLYEIEDDDDDFEGDEP
jgi:hypothetical protein